MRPALTTDDLKAIQSRNYSPDVRALLWEIRRLRVIINRADQLNRSMPTELGGDAIGIIARELRAQLEEDPYVQECRAARREMLYPERPK